MTKMEFATPDEHVSMLTGLRKIPFAKMEDGYRFAYWVYDLNDSEEKQQALLESPNGQRAAELLQEAKAALESIVVDEDDYLAWTVHKKEAGGVLQYHKVIHDLSISLMMLTINIDAKTISGNTHWTEDVLYAVKSQQKSNDWKHVLNRSNPFADVTIKSQQFFYKAGDGSTETLFFNTNNIVEKVDKNGRDMLTMRPGFSVTKEHGVAQKPMQKVTFANSITEPVVGDEDHIYIHID